MFYVDSAGEEPTVRGGGCFIVREDNYGGGRWDGDQLELWAADYAARTNGNP